jgi:hypothetical protein
MKRQIKLNQQAEEQQQTTAGQETRQESAQEFASVEKMLRHDALHTPVPPSIAERLAKSIGPIPARSWWRRWFKK